MNSSFTLPYAIGLLKTTCMPKNDVEHLDNTTTRCQHDSPLKELQSHPCEWSPSSRIMNNVLDGTLDVTISLSCIQYSVPCRTLPVGVVGLEHGPSTLALGSNDAPHRPSLTCIRKNRVIKPENKQKRCKSGPTQHVQQGKSANRGGGPASKKHAGSSRHTLMPEHRTGVRRRGHLPGTMSSKVRYQFRRLHPLSCRAVE